VDCVLAGGHLGSIFFTGCGAGAKLAFAFAVIAYIFGVVPSASKDVLVYVSKPPLVCYSNSSHIFRWLQCREY